MSDPKGAHGGMAARPEGIGAVRSAVADLTVLADTYWAMTLEDNPVYATALGDRRFDDRLPDESIPGLERMQSRRTTLLERAEAIEPAGLPDDDRVTLAALRESLRGDLAALSSRISIWTVDPLDGIPSGLLTIPEYQRLETPADGARMVARWRAMAPYVDTHIANLRAALADGLVASRAPVDRVLDQLRRLLAEPSHTWPLFRPASTVDELAGWSDGDRTRFRHDLGAAVDGGIRPALERLHAALDEEIAPRARPDDRAGIGALDGGPDAYARLLRHHTSLDVTADELHQTGLAEIARIDEELRELAGRVLGGGTREAALERLRGDPALQFASRDEVEATAVRSLARANEAVGAWFGRLPQTPCVVVRMAAHEEPHSTIAYYRQPATDGSRPGQYVVNTSAPETRPRYEAEVLAFHEAVPGHHLQIALGQELTDLPSFRRHLGPTGFVEGWGLYTERLCEEMGLYSGDLDRIGVRSYDAWRAGRLVVDTGIHAFGWSREQAIAFMLDHTALAANNVANEIDRYIVWPGQAVAYKTGQLELLRLRTAALEQLRDRFDIRGFHDAVLGQGAVPLAVLPELVETWAARRAGRT